MVLRSMCWLSRAVAPEARRERAVTWEGRKPDGLCSAIQEARSKEVMHEEGRGVKLLPTAQRRVVGGAESDRR